MTGRYLTAARLGELDAQLSSRDRAVVRRVSELRFVSGAQLMRLHFPGVPMRTTREALLRLNRLGLLERLPRPVGGVRAGSAGYVYRLGSAGQRLSVNYGWQPAGRKRQAHVPGTMFVDHALRVAELHTLLVEADRSGIIELLELAAEPACWRRYGGAYGQPQTLKPDSYVRLGAGDFEDSYFIEVDMGTEGSRALERKLKDYLAYAASGVEQTKHGVFPKTLWTTPDAERASAIKACIGRLSQPRAELFAVVTFDEALTTVGGGAVTHT